MLKSLLDDITSETMLADLKKMIKAFNKKGDWRHYIVKDKRHLKVCENKNIRRQDGKIYLISKTEIHSRHNELFSYNMYLNEFEGKEYEPFSEVRYKESTSSYEEPYIELEFPYNNNDYCIRISHTGNHKYNFDFADQSDNFYRESPKKFPEKIKEILGDLKFEKGCKEGIEETNIMKEIEEIQEILKTFL